MTTTATLPTNASGSAGIAREEANQLAATLGHDRWEAFEVIAALAKAHPMSGYNADHGGGLGQIRAEHLNEAKALAADRAAARDASIAAEGAKESEAKAAQTAGAKFGRIRDAIKAGLRRTDHGEDATPDAYAQAKAAAEAEQDAAELRAEGEQEARTASKRIARAKAEAVSAAKTDLPVLPHDELDAAVADARAAIERIRAIGAERDALVRQHGRAFAAAGFAPRWGGPEGGTGIQDNGTVWIDGTGYGPREVNSWLAQIKSSITEVR